MTLHEWFTRYPPGFWSMGYFDAFNNRPARFQCHLDYLVGYQAAIDECEKRGAVR